VRTKDTDKTGFEASFQPSIDEISLSSLVLVGSVVPSHRCLPQPGQSCAAKRLADFGGIFNRIAAPHSQRSSISFSSFTSIVVTLWGVIAQPFFGFGAAFSCFRKSRLMDAASFLVDTRFSIAFLPFSIVRLP
jgi:hypothetical protein